jgi:glycosyltransferase involved in cell wall biosynthesis
MTPRVTVVLPTRERCDTLQWALRTCITQDYDNLEIVVSDNASTDDTRDVVSSFDDPRIRYVNPGRRVKMAENWEFGVSHARPGYVGILGDDDGVMPRGISAMAELIEAEPVDALIWPVYNYYWPGYVDRNLANCLTLPTTTRGRTQTVDSRKILRDVSNFQRHVHWLPSIYWGMVSTAAIDRARNDRGVFLNSITPDIYAGVAVAAVIDRHLRIDAPLTLSGESRDWNCAHQISGF